MIAVLGATGRVGSAVLDDLAARDVDAFGVARRAADTPHELRLADVLEPGALEHALRGAHRLFLLAPNTAKQPAYEAAALRAARELGIEHIVKVSGGAASLGPNGTTPTAIAHWRSEQAIEASGTGFTFLRPSFFAQNLLEAPAAVARAAGILPDPFAGAAIAMVDVRDVAACAAAALVDPPPASQAYRITGSRPVTMSELAAYLGLRRLPVPAAATARSLRRSGHSEFEVEHALRMAEYFAAGSDATTTDHVHRLTGQAPRPIEALLDEHRADFLPTTWLARMIAHGHRTKAS